MGGEILCICRDAVRQLAHLFPLCKAEDMVHEETVQHIVICGCLELYWRCDNRNIYIDYGMWVPDEEVATKIKQTRVK